MKISIIIPTFLGANYLNHFSLPSLVQQDWTDWEAIIVDDGSTDDTANIAKLWTEKDARIKYLSHPKNLGLAAALNTGLKYAQGEIVAFLEQDDIWLPNKLSAQLKVLENKQLVSCNFFYFDPKHKRLSGNGGGNFSTLMGQKKTLEKIFPLPEDPKYLGIEDGLVAGRLALLVDKHELAPDDLFYLKDWLVIVTRHPDSLSGHGKSAAYAARYQAALSFFKSDNAPGLKKLKRSWKWRRYFNLLLSPLPFPLTSFLRLTLSTLSTLYRWRLSKLKKLPNYSVAKELVTSIDKHV